MEYLGSQELRSSIQGALNKSESFSKKSLVGDL